MIPVIVHPCEWHDMPFGHLRATPQDGKPLWKFPNAHDGFVDVIKDIKAAADLISESAPIPRANRNPLSARPPAPEQIRSSNLRVRKKFTERDVDDFINTSSSYVSQILRELPGRAKHPATMTYRRKVQADRRHPLHGGGL